MKNILMFLLCCCSYQIQQSCDSLNNRIRNFSQNIFCFDPSQYFRLKVSETQASRAIDENQKEAWENLFANVSKGDAEGAYQEVLQSSDNIDFNKKDHRTGDTLLIRAIKNKDVDMVKFLLDSGAHVNVSNFSGMTPLMNAIISGNKVVVDCLLSQQHISLNQKNEFGDTALMIACSCSDVNIVRSLVSRGAKLDELDKQGQLAYGRLRYFDCDSVEHKQNIKELIASLKQATHLVLAKQEKLIQVQNHVPVRESLQLPIEKKRAISPVRSSEKIVDQDSCC